jgi:acyl carrier protein
LDPGFLDDLSGNSLDRVELVMALDEVFDIEIPEKDVKKFRMIPNVIDYLNKRGKGGNLN